MAKNSVNDWDTTPANNLDLADIPLVEGVTMPSAVNNLFRTMMAQIKTYLPIATTAEFLANTAGKWLRTGEVNAAGAALALTDAASITWDMALGFNSRVTLAGNRTMALPTNRIAGRSGAIRVTQDATGSRTLSYASGWKGQVPALSTTAAAIDLVFYFIDPVSLAPTITGIQRNVA